MAFAVRAWTGNFFGKCITLAFMIFALLNVFAAAVEEVKDENEDDEHEHNLENDFSQKDLTVVTSIVLILILLTVAFETFKERLEESVHQDLKIILEKLFGELTVLGFLAIVTFSCTQTGVISRLSLFVYHEEEELLEFFEYVHFSIFAIMIAFVVQVIVLVSEASTTEDKWERMDTKCRELRLAEGRHDDALVFPSSSEQEAAIHLRSIYWLTRFFKGFRDKKEYDRKEFFMFQALRNEFILDRGLEPPFEPRPVISEADDFNFGRYLSLAQAHILTHIVEVKVHTWICFAAGALCWYLICISVNRHEETLAWIWLAIGWLVLCANLVFEQHLYNLRRTFIPKKLLEMLYHEDRSSDELHEESQRSYRETTNLLSDTSPEYLPAWCGVDVDSYVQRGRSFLSKMFVGGVPNRQQTYFWFDRKGPSYYKALLQINLIFVGVYTGLLLLVFFPFLFHLYSIHYFILYIVVAIIPPYIITVNKRDIVATLTQVTSIGTYRKVQIISDVLREEKTYQVVRAFIIINRMRRHARRSSSTSNHHESETTHHSNMSRASTSFTRLELAEVSKTFDTLDLDHSGTITREEFQDMLRKLGAKTSEEEIQQILSSLDSDNDGEVSREEFLNWYTRSIESEEIDPKKRAKDLFELFDSNDSDEITIGEFKNKLDSLNMGFSVDEIGAIVNELDSDRSGTVSLEEFEELIEKYHPKELKVRHDHASHH